MRFDMIMDEEQYEDLLNTIEDGEGLFDADDTGPREYKKISELQGLINLYTQINCTIVRDESPHEVELEFGLGHSGLCDSDMITIPSRWMSYQSCLGIRKNEAGTGFRHLRVCYAIFERSTTPESIVRLGDDQWGIQGAIVLHTIASLGKGADDVFSSESRPLEKLWRDGHSLHWDRKQRPNRTDWNMANFHPSETYADDKVTISSARLFVFEPEAGPADAASSTATKRRYFFHVIASNDPRLAVSIDVKYEDWHGYIHDSRPNIVDTLDFEWRMDNRPNERPAWVLPETLTPKLYTEISFQCERNLDLQPSQGHDPFEDEYEDLSDASYAVEGTLTIHDLGDSEALA